MPILGKPGKPVMKILRVCISLYEQCLQLNYFPDLIRSIPPAEPDLVMAKPAASEEKEVAKLGTCAVALYDYQAADDTEISFDPDQV